MTDLKPCPFCGGEARGAHEDYGDTHYWRVYCDTIGCAFGMSKVFHSEAEAIAAWNARYHCGLTDEDYNILLDELGVSERTCECVEEYAKSPIDGKTIVLHRCSTCNELMRQNMNYCPNCGSRVIG